jgi:hypothetical protein
MTTTPNEQSPAGPDAKVAQQAAAANTTRSMVTNPWFLVPALAVSVFFGATLWSMTRTGTAKSPLEPTAATQSVLVPTSSESVKPRAPLPNMVPATAAVVAVASTAQPSDAMARVAAPSPAAANDGGDGVPALRALVQELKGRVEQLEVAQREQEGKLASVTTELATLKSSGSHTSQMVVATTPLATKLQVADKATDSGARRRHSLRARSVEGRAGAKPGTGALADSRSRIPETGAVLAVDMWGGVPSVAVARTGATGTELRFLNEGESQGNVTLKSADMAAQKATFNTPAGDLTLASQERAK